MDGITECKVVGLIDGDATSSTDGKEEGIIDGENVWTNEGDVVG